MPNVPESLKVPLRDQFDDLYAAFGGKLAHWSDFVRDYVSAQGRLTSESLRSLHKLKGF